MPPAPKREVFENRVIFALSRAENANFLEGVEDVSRYVAGDDEAQVIHRTYLGVTPDVLINNTVYPIPEQAIADEDVPITLDKYQTKQTSVTDDELFASTYDRIDATNRLHVQAITENRYDKAIHSLAPSGNAAKTPVILTTGADDGTGRKKLLKADLIAFRRGLGSDFRPGMRLVLCNNHINDILEWDEQFDRQYAERESGVITRKYGFDIYSYAKNPLYDVTTKARKSFGAVAGANDQEASIAFFAPRAVKAQGKTKMYWAKSETRPDVQKNTINYRTYFIAMNTVQERIGALVSGKV